jgi:hypothetical protein
MIQKRNWETEERQRDYYITTDREINALAAAILRLLEWQHNMMQLKQENRIKRMLKRQLLSRLRKNSEFSLSD